MSSVQRIRWLDEPEEKDYLAAHSFLSMVLAPSLLSETIAALRTAPLGHWAAKDILRAAGLPPLKPKQSAEVAEKLKKIREWHTDLAHSPRWRDPGLPGHRRRVPPRIGRMPG